MFISNGALPFSSGDGPLLTTSSWNIIQDTKVHPMLYHLSIWADFCPVMSLAPH